MRVGILWVKWSIGNVVWKWELGCKTRAYCWCYCCMCFFCWLNGVANYLHLNNNFYFLFLDVLW